MKKRLVFIYHHANSDIAEKVRRVLKHSNISFDEITDQSATFNYPLFKQIDPESNVLALISDNFLKSEECMYKALDHLRDIKDKGNFTSIITAGRYYNETNKTFFNHSTRIERVVHVIQYLNYWQEEYLEARQSERLSKEVSDSLSKRVSVIKSISGECGDFLKLLNEKQKVNIEELEDKNFETLGDWLQVGAISSAGVDLNVDAASFAINTTKAVESAPEAVQEVVEKAAVETPTVKETVVENIKPPVVETPKVKVEPPVVEKKEAEITASHSDEVARALAEIDADQGMLDTFELDFSSPNTNMQTELKAIIDDTQEEEHAVQDNVIADSDNDTALLDFDLPIHATKPSTRIELVNSNTTTKEPPTILPDVEAMIEHTIERKESTKVAAEEKQTETIDFNLSEQPSTAQVEPSNDLFESLDDVLSSNEVTVEETEVKEEEAVFEQDGFSLFGDDFDDPEFFVKTTQKEEIRNLLERKEQAEAFELLNSLIAKYPNDTSFQIIKAQALMTTETNPEEGIELLKDIADKNPEDALPAQLLADLALERKNPVMAKQWYEKALKADPDNSIITYKLGTLSKNSANQGGYLNGTTTLSPEEDYQEAIEHLKDATKLNPAHPFAFHDLAEIYAKLGENEKAAHYFSIAKRNNPALDTPSLNSKFSLNSMDFTPFEFSKEMLEPVGNGKTVFITGATSGIGRACAELFASKGYKLILSGRRADRLGDLKHQLQDNYESEIVTLNFDVRDLAKTKEQIENLEASWLDIDILINNAGLALGFSGIHEGDIDEWDTMIDTNIKGLLYMTRTVAPIMVRRKKGHIINICSIAGKEVYPNGNVYCATKHAVDALTKAMRIDLVNYNVKVGQICPAHVEDTEFALVRFNQDEERAKIYEHFNPLRASDVADIAMFMVDRPAHVNILDVVAQGTQQASATITNTAGRLFD